MLAPHLPLGVDIQDYVLNYPSMCQLCSSFILEIISNLSYTRGEEYYANPVIDWATLLGNAIFYWKEHQPKGPLLVRNQRTLHKMTCTEGNGKQCHSKEEKIHHSQRLLNPPQVNILILKYICRVPIKARDTTNQNITEKEYVETDLPSHENHLSNPKGWN